MGTNDLTVGNVKKKVLLFALPYLLSSFMQTLYGLVDLYVVGLFNEKETSAAVANGSQIIHMLTVIIVGMAMGTTVKVGMEIGHNNKNEVRKAIGTSICLFTIMALALSVVLLVFTDDIVRLVMTPASAVDETVVYLRICFAGTPFIVAYNVISAVFRGMGDTKRPMYFVAVACVINVVTDIVFVGVLGMGAAGAALGTVCGQAGSVVLSLVAVFRLARGRMLSKEEIRLDGKCAVNILKVGIPISLQDGMIQVAFIVITVIANRMGIITATSVGTVEKIIGFLFLVPSAFLASLSTITAHNIGAGKDERAECALRFGLAFTVTWGMLCGIICNIIPEFFVGMFTKDCGVLKAGCDYLRSYSFDTMFAAIHFCFSGYFCGCQKAHYSFIHNIISIVMVRVPGSYMAARLWKGKLFYMGMAAPAGSLLSALICVMLYMNIKKKSIRMNR